MPRPWYSSTTELEVLDIERYRLLGSIAHDRPHSGKDCDAATDERKSLTEFQVYRFPNTLGTDRGRAMNQQEPGRECLRQIAGRLSHEFVARA
jgi:hypothetical protein